MTCEIDKRSTGMHEYLATIFQRLTSVLKLEPERIDTQTCDVFGRAIIRLWQRWAMDVRVTARVEGRQL